MILSPLALWQRQIFQESGLDARSGDWSGAPLVADKRISLDDDDATAKATGSDSLISGQGKSWERLMKKAAVQKH